MNIAQNPNSELSHFAVNTPQVFEIPETFRETARQFQEAMMQYSCCLLYTSMQLSRSSI